MSMQSTDSDTENPSDEHSSEEPATGSAYGELLATSSLEELEEKPWEVKLALLQHHLELARIFVGELLEEEVDSRRRSKRKPASATATTTPASAVGEPTREASGSEKRRSRSPCPAWSTLRPTRPSPRSATLK